MKITVTGKSFKFSESLRESLFEKIGKLNSIFPNFNENLLDLDLILRRNSAHNFFEVSLKITLPKRVLFARLEGEDPASAIENIFEKILREAETYRGKHFKSYSKYKDHSSIRRSES